jgi:tetratricopeptide (TPR) repeat protein
MPFFGRSQSASALVHEIQSSVSAEDIRRNLTRLWQVDSTHTYQVAPQVLTSFEMLHQPLTRVQADTLLRIYAIGEVYDPAGPQHWLLQRALLGHRLPEHYSNRARKWIMEAIASIPQEVPSFLFEAAGHDLAEAYNSMQVSLNVAARDWATLSRVLLVHQVSNSPDAPLWAQVRAQLTLEMRSVLPDCNQLYGNFSEALGLGKLPADACETFLVLYDLQGCDQPALWEAAMKDALQASENAWLYRLAGTEAFNRGQMAQSRSHWLKACSLETIPSLQANDQLQIAATYRAEKDFRKARSCLQDAMRRHPNWGEPYLHLMDLYLVGSESCTMTEFERKGLYWLLIELCQRLKAVDENYAAEADARYYQYVQACPSPAEASFQGWKPGDTYPLKCWMSTVTVVP